MTSPCGESLLVAYQSCNRIEASAAPVSSSQWLLPSVSAKRVSKTARVSACPRCYSNVHYTSPARGPWDSLHGSQAGHSGFAGEAPWLGARLAIGGQGS